MLLLVMGENLLLLFCWLGRRRAVFVPADWLLVYRRGKRPAPGKKAFIVNRVGDAGFFAGRISAVLELGRQTGCGPCLFTEIQANASVLSAGTVHGDLSPIVLSVQLEKSAQIPLYVWLAGCHGGSLLRSVP